MSKVLVRHRLMAVMGLLLSLMTASLQAQTEAKDVQKTQAAQSKEQTAEIEALRKKLAAKQKEIELYKEASRDLTAQLKPLREKQQHERDSKELKSQPRFAQTRPGPSEARIQAVLNVTTVVEFIETPLVDVVAYLKDLHGIEIQLDQKALSDAGIDTDVPITRKLRDITLRSALALLLRDLDLTWLVDHGVLLITTNEAARHHLETRTYDVQSLLKEGEQAAELVEVLTFVARNPQRHDVARDVPAPTERGRSTKSGMAAIGYRNLVIVRATQQGHRQIEQLLRQIAIALEPHDKP